MNQSNRPPRRRPTYADKKLMLQIMLELDEGVRCIYVRDIHRQLQETTQSLYQRKFVSSMIREMGFRLKRRQDGIVVVWNEDARRQAEHKISLIID